MKKILIFWYAAVILCILPFSSGIGQKVTPKFKAIAFYTAKNDLAHISFVHEANRWFS
jgi:hypothetical protein